MGQTCHLTQVHGDIYFDSYLPLADGSSMHGMFLTLLLHFFHDSRNFLIHHPSKANAVVNNRGPQIQRLEAWDPSDMDLKLFEYALFRSLLPWLI